MRPLTHEEIEQQKRQSTIHWWATGRPKYYMRMGGMCIAIGIAALAYTWIALVSFTGSILFVAGIGGVTGIAFVYTGVRLLLDELSDWYRYVRRPKNAGVGEA